MSNPWPASEQPEDDALVERAKQDRAAFGELFDRYYPRVLRYCLRRLHDRDTAEDVAADAFLQVAGHLGDFGGHTETDFRCWLFAIATNAVNAQARRARRRNELWQAHRENAADDRVAGRAPGEFEPLDWPAVYEALEQLDQREQTIVMLRFFADMNAADIGQIVGATPGAVRTSLSRTLARLREKFDPVRPTRPEA